MQIYKVPLTGQQEKFKLRFKGVQYSCTIYWNYLMENWVISFYLATDNTPLVLAMPLVTGVDLLKQYKYLEIGGRLLVYTNGSLSATPTYTDLGSESNLYFVVD